MAKGRILGNARKNKNDEFYTQLSDIEKELKYYKKYFEDKVVFCNCDDPYESDFFKYFALNFNELKLKKLICTCYAGSPIVTEQLSLFDVKGLKIKEEEAKHPYKIEIVEIKDENNDGAIDLTDVGFLLKNKKNILTLLDGDGDFRSDECAELLKEADIVVTNPPFSLWRDYVHQLIEYDKKFLIIGNINAIGYKEIFPLFKENKMWLGVSIHSGDREFRIPDYYETDSPSLRIDKDGKRYVRVVGVRWFTNLDNDQRHENIILYKKYNPIEYPSYENFDGINVSSTAEIPCDYYGVMGVPVSFIDKYNPSQFKIVGFGAGELGTESGVRPYDRKLKKLSSALRDGIPFIYDKENNKVIVPYARIFIQRIDVEECAEDGNKVA